jgi:tetratricopeptide (TPR) repeat protein
MSYIKKFNPYDLSEQTLGAIATGRERVLEEILAIIAGNAEGGRVQHLQVVAPRGYGKSFLMRMVQSALKARVAEGLPAVLALLPEEQHNVDAPHRLLNEIQRVLEGRPADSLLGGAFAESDGAWEQAVVALDTTIAAKLPEGRGIAVAVVENFDQLISDVFRRPRDQSRLRALLDRPGGRLMLLATATRRADAAYEQRLFHATRLIELEPWKEETCLSFFERLRGHRRAGTMSPQLQAKARALAQFIGGSPRMATVLAEVLDSNDSLRVAQMLDALVDELTPYYKHRIESLPRRSRTLLDALLRMGEPRTQSEIAARLGTTQARIAEPFNELRAGGEVVGVKAQHSAEMLYRVADRLLAHYYRKRHLGVGEGVSLLEGIVEFLESFYTPAEQREEAERLRALNRPKDAAVFERLIMANKALLDSERSGLDPGNGWLDELRKRLIALDDAGRNDEAFMLCQQAVKRAEVSGTRKEVARSQRFLGWALNEMGRHEEAEKELRRALALGEQVGDLREQMGASRVLGWVLCEMGRYEQAEKEMLRALALGERVGDLSEQTEALRLLGGILSEMGRHKDAAKELRRALVLGEQVGDLRQQAKILRSLSSILSELGRHEEAEKELRRAFALAEEVSDLYGQARASRSLGWTLNKMGRHGEAEKELHRALALAEQGGNASDIAWTLVECLRVAKAIGNDVAIVTAWRRALAVVAAAPVTGGFPDLSLLLNIAAVAALRSQQFGTVWSMTAALRVDAIILARAQRDLAVTVVDASKTQGRAVAYSLAAHGIEVLAQDAADRATRESLSGLEPIDFLRVIIFILARELTDPALLRDIAALLEQRLPSETMAERALLEAAARRAENPDDPAALERVDPDIATVLERMLGTGSKPSATARPRRGRRTSEPRRKK